MMRKKSLYDFRGFIERPDSSLAESLAVYGLAGVWRNKRELTLVYGVRVNSSGDFDRFAYTWFSVKDWTSMIGEQWFDLDAVCAYCYTSKEDFAELNIFNLQSAISYHGTENILGSCYFEGFEIKGVNE